MTEENDLQVFATGTMRTGGSMVQNMLSVHSQLTVFAGFVSFFRFYYGKYEPLTAKNIERMIHHLRIRLKSRRDYNLDAEKIIENILKRERTYKSCYQEIMRNLVMETGKPGYGEYVTLGWREIPTYLELFPNAKVIHIYRDLRAIIASFSKMTNMPNRLYLQAIFNWVDSINYMKKYSTMFGKDQYYPIRFEDIHYSPHATAQSLCDFLNIRYEASMTDPDVWPSLFDKNFVDANISSYTKQKVYGFDHRRTDRWKDEIEEWELKLCEHLAREQLETAGYDVPAGSLHDRALTTGIRHLEEDPILAKTYRQFLLTGEGTDKAVLDPTDPSNWDAPGNASGKFINTDRYTWYTDEHDRLEAFLDEKYGSGP